LSELSAPARSLSRDERAGVLAVLHDQRFQDRSPAAVQATLLDEGQYLCSARTMYRLLEQAGESRERRDQLVHPAYQRPELLATAPNQLWSWDITKLLGPAKWTYFYLYVILDVFSRYVVGWMVAPRESAELAKHLIEETIRKQEISAGQLTIHADRGRVMTSKPVAFLMADLGVTKTHSRPYVSDDNPYSESQFRTMKYRPEFPDRLHPGRSRLLSTVLPVVQRGASPLGAGLADPGCGPFRPSSSRVGGAPGCTRCRLPGAPGPLRPATAQNLTIALGGVDQ
jgi:transposase InsO family protein